MSNSQPWLLRPTAATTTSSVTAPSRAAKPGAVRLAAGGGSSRLRTPLRSSRPAAQPSTSTCVGLGLADYGRVCAAERGRLSRALAGGAHGRAVCMRPHAAGPRAGPDCLHTVSRSRARQRPHGHPPQHRAGQAMNSLRAPPQPAPHRGHVVYGAAKGQLAVLLHRFHGHERAVHDEAAPAQSTLPL